jgi:hypothetical protein
MPEPVVSAEEDLSLQLTIPVQISDLRDIFSTATCYIHYWCHISNKTENWARLIKLDDYTERLPENKEDYEIFEVTPEFVLLGIQRLLSKEVQVNQQIYGWLSNAMATGDMGMIDVTVADCIMQAACFNELVYG